jgi:putative transposase
MEDSDFIADGLTIGIPLRCMKGERIRYQRTGEFHFLTFSCYRRRPYLSTVAAMELFEDALERVRLRYLFAVAGYVVMPEHVHLLVNEPRRGLFSRSVQALKLSVSMRSRERPFWQAHYYDLTVSAHAKFVEKLRYIHRNPVRRGLVEKPEECRPTDENLSVGTPTSPQRRRPVAGDPGGNGRAFATIGQVCAES